MKERNTEFFNFKFEDKEIYIIEDHPTIIKCLYHAYHEKKIPLKSLLFHIDMHLDLIYIEKNHDKSRKILKMSNEELDRFIRDDLHKDNSEFITNLFHSGLIQHCISIVHCEFKKSGNCKFIKGENMEADKYQIPNDENEYFNHVHGTEEIHKIMESSTGLLSKENIDYSIVKNLFKSNDLILSIDLDYFTYSSNGSYPKNTRDIQKQITSHSFKEILAKSKVVVLALEPRCCGGIIGSFEILRIFNKNIFNQDDLEKKVKEKLGL